MKHLHLTHIRRLAATLLVALLVPLGAWAQQYDFTATVDGNTLYFKITDATNHYVSVVSPTSTSWGSFTSPTGAVNLPATVTNESTDYTLTAIGNYAFRGCTGMTDLSLPNTVKTIGSNAFDGAGLTSLDLDIETIGYSAFYDCKSLTTLTIGPNVKSIDYYAFRGCTALESVTYNATEGTTTSSVSSNGVFSGCTHAATLTIGSGVTNLPNYLFRDFTGLNEVANWGGVTTIGNGTFRGTGFTTLTIPAQVTSLGRNAFYSCTLDRLVIADSETALEYTGQYPPFDGTATWSSDHYNYTNGTIKSAYIGRQLNNTYNTTYPSYMKFANYIEQLELDTNVTDINQQFFATGGLQGITVRHTTPITIADNAFCNTEGTSYTGGNQYGTAILWVPAGTRSAYKAADGWKNFTDIRPSHFLISMTATKRGKLTMNETEEVVSDTKDGEETKSNILLPYADNAVFATLPSRGYELVTLAQDGEAVLKEGDAGFNKSEASSYTVSSPVTPDNDGITMKANYKAIVYTLTYDLAGGTAPEPNNPDSYTVEDEITLKNPTRTGYDFAGWTGTELDGAQTTVTIADAIGDRAYTATWTPIVYNITYENLDYTPNVGMNAEENPATYTIESAAITLQPATRRGYTFGGWFDNEELTGDAVTTIATGSYGNKAVWASWTPITYTISYDLDGGTVATANPTSYTIESADITLVNPTKEHYDFAGWTGSVLGGSPAETVTIAQGSTGNRSYTATWTKAVYAVSVSGNGASLVSLSDAAPQYEDDVVVTIASDEDSELTSFTVDGVEHKDDLDSDGKYTIASVSANVNIVVTITSTKEFITLAHSQQTFSCPQALDFTGSDLKAYIASGYDDGTVILTRVEKVPANTGLLIVGTEGELYKIPYATVKAVYSNFLKPVLTAQTVAATTGEYTNYLYGEVDGVKGFYKSSGSGEVAAQKAYLQLPTSAVAGVKAFSLTFDDPTTGLSSIDGEEPTIQGAVYDLNGRKVADEFNPKRLPKGIYIVGGKKVTNK